MEYFPAPLEKLVEQFARLPGIGSKSAQRLAFHVLNLPMAQAQEFADAIVDAKQQRDPLSRLPQPHRRRPVPHLRRPQAGRESASAWWRIHGTSSPWSAASEFHGRYHVLHGVLSPMNHVGPDDLQIKPLVDRVAQGGIREVIMATNPDTEGEATALYLARLLKPFGVKVTRLAYGIPVGGHLEFADDATLTRALEGRREL